jgi:prepilin-type N-terminal cleavage/methylation domain-containing protein
MKRKAFTLVELMVVISIIALLMGLLLPALSSAMRSAKSKKEMVQLRGLHQTMGVYASENDGKYPIPGNIRRDPLNGPGGQQFIQGVGKVKPIHNHTAAIASTLISMKYAQPEIMVSPAENNAEIGIKGQVVEGDEGEPVAYDYAAWQPHNGSYWDESFRARLGNDEADHISFSNLTLLGPARRGRWHDTAGGDTIVWSSRGTKDGDTSSDEYSKNPILQMHGPENTWNGHTVSSDGAVLVAQNFYPEQCKYDTQALGSPGYKRDNMFCPEFNTAFQGIHGDEEAMRQGDIYMTYSYLMAPNDDIWVCQRTYDELED